MSSEFQLEVVYDSKSVYADTLSQPIELGRLDPEREKADLLGVRQPKGNGYRVAIVDPDERGISREHVLIEPLSTGRLRVKNLCKTIVRLDTGDLVRGESREIGVPGRFFIGPAEVRLDTKHEFQTLAPTQFIPSHQSRRPPSHLTTAFLDVANDQADSLVAWLENIVGVLQTALSSREFHQSATRAMVKLVGLDSGRVMLREGNTWKQVAHEWSDDCDEGINSSHPSMRLLNALLRDKRTLWSGPTQESWNSGESMQGVQAVVAAPIFDGQGEVRGALYGDRQFKSSGPPGDFGLPQISKAEAMLVQVLATSVAAGLARIDEEEVARRHEQEALAARARFSQFFTPELSEKLAANPDMLKGQKKDVTLLFCDIREFSKISQRLEPTVTMEWIYDVMGALSDCVMNHQGVLVNYIGDELIGMWGAPTDQPDQAVLACQAALAMHRALPALNERWNARLGREFRVGIGINTGEAQVGNTGSYRKLQYGPLGNTVNLASRVQGATKHIGADIMITAATQARLPADMATRRLCKVRVVNIDEPVDLYELRANPDDAWHSLRESYQGALQDFETQNFRRATEVLGRINAQFPGDRPSRVLLKRSVPMLDEDGEFNPKWDCALALDQK